MSNPFFMSENPAYKRFDVGQWSYGSPNVMFEGFGAKLKIGKFCSIAAGVTILLGGEHRMDWVTTYPFNGMIKEAMIFNDKPYTKGDVVIGNDVWIGINALILSGITIGNGAVIAAGSVVTKDVPPYAIVGGNPAKLIRYRFSPEIIERLQAIAWWNWPFGRIVAAFPHILNTDVDNFTRLYGG